MISWEMLQSDPREHAVRIEEHGGHDERVAAVRVFQRYVEAQCDSAPKVPLLHLAWCMLQEASRRPSATSAVEFAVFRGVETPVAASGGPASPTTGGSVAAKGGASLAAANAESLTLPERPLDAVIAAGDLMPHLLPGDVPAFNAVMHGLY